MLDASVAMHVVFAAAFLCCDAVAAYCPSGVFNACCMHCRMLPSSCGHMLYTTCPCCMLSALYYQLYLGLWQ